MNDGYFALIGLWFLLLLLWSGWFDAFLQRHQINHRLLILCIIVSLIGGNWKWRAIDHGDIRLIPYVLPLLLGVYLWIKEGDRYRVHLITASFLIGASVFLMQLLFQYDPILMVMDEKYLVVLLVTLLIIVAAKHATHQFILLVFGLGFSDLCFQIYLWDKAGFFSLGSFYYQDTWVLSIFGLIFARYLLQYVKWPAFLKRKRAETSS